MEGVSFDSVEAARAAFALGPVRFRCRVCGKVHNSGDYDSYRMCLLNSYWGDAVMVPTFRDDFLEAFPARLPLWAVLGREWRALEYYWMRCRLDLITRVFVPDINAEPYFLALTEGAFDEVMSRKREERDKCAWEYSEAIASEAERIRDRYPKLRKKLLGPPDSSIFPVELEFIRNNNGVITGLKKISFADKIISFGDEPIDALVISADNWKHRICEKPFQILTPAQLKKRVGLGLGLYAEVASCFHYFIYDIERIFKLNRSRSRKGASFSLYDMKLAPEGAYFTVLRYGFSLSWTGDYLILFLEGYKRPKVLGVLEDKESAMLDRALEILPKVGADISPVWEVKPCLL